MQKYVAQNLSKYLQRVKFWVLDFCLKCNLYIFIFLQIIAGENAKVSKIDKKSKYKTRFGNVFAVNLVVWVHYFLVGIWKIQNSLF